MSTRILRTVLIATFASLAFTACDGDPGPHDGTGGDDVSAIGDAADDVSTSVCAPDGPFGTFTNVSGGQSGVMACGHSFTTFSGATITITASDGGGALLTVTGTGTIGDTMNCPATVDECHVTASACPTGGGSTVSYDLNTFSHQIGGTASPMIPDPSGGCQFVYSLDGTR